nr:MAG TPA: hypothetical protein [Caudoviricetes sp.]
MILCLRTIVSNYKCCNIINIIKNLQIFAYAITWRFFLFLKC